ncbi:MAG: DUF1573 domain-containing protein [Chitinophagaceae bacterium]
MKIAIFLLSILLLVASILYIIYKRNNIKNKITDIMVSKEVIDIGDRLKNSSSIGKYTIYNTGKYDLYIKSVEPDCHCTVSQFSKDRIRPTDSTVILLRYDSTRLGIFQTSALVNANSSRMPLLLILRGNIIDSSVQYKN